MKQIDPTLIQYNLLVWAKGNPAIKSISSLNTNISYQWWNKHVTLYVSLTNGVDFKNIYRTAMQSENGDGIILSYNQGTNWITTHLNMSATWYITREVALTATGNFMNYHKTAPVNENKLWGQGDLKAQWFRKKFGIYAVFSSPWLSQGFNAYTKTSTQYAIGANLLLGKWFLSLAVRNPFNTKKAQKMWNTIPGDLYSISNHTYTRRNSTDISLSATYTIRYGKKDINQKLEEISSDQSLMQ